MSRANPKLGAAVEPRLRLQVTRTRPGPAVERSEVAVFGPVVEIGRRSDADLVLDAPAASRRHARFVAADGAWWIEDLSSRAGTRLGERALPAGRYRVDVGAIVGLPGVTLAVIEAADAAGAEGGAPTPLESLARAYRRLDRGPAPGSADSPGSRSQRFRRADGPWVEVAAMIAALGFVALAVSALVVDCG